MLFNNPHVCMIVIFSKEEPCRDLGAGCLIFECVSTVNAEKFKENHWQKCNGEDSMGVEAPRRSKCTLWIHFKHQMYPFITYRYMSSSDAYPLCEISWFNWFLQMTKSFYSVIVCTELNSCIFTWSHNSDMLSSSLKKIWSLTLLDTWLRR